MPTRGRYSQTVIITDAHVHPGFGNAESFIAMLTVLESLPVDVVFLGDVFDLWIALPRYEDNMQRAFLEWCDRNKENRTVGFVEGNHEFFVHQSHASCFTWSTEDEMSIPDRGWFFVHGDKINRQDRQYLRFRRMTKNSVAKWIVRWFPFGPRWVRFLNSKLKSTNQNYRLHFPRTTVEAFAKNKFEAGFSQVFIGHFHTQFCIEMDSGCAFWVFPAWLEQEWVAVINEKDNAINTYHWNELTRRINTDS